MPGYALDETTTCDGPDNLPSLEVGRLGQMLSIESAKVELSTQFVEPTVDDDGAIVPVRRTESLTHPNLPRANAGLLGVLMYAALKQGLSLHCVRQSPVPRRLPSPQHFSAADMLPDIHLPRFISSREHALVRYDPGRVQISHLIAQIPAAWPEVTIAVPTGTSEAATSLYYQLTAMGVPVTLATPKSCPDNPARIVIGTFGSMWHWEIEWEKRDIVVVPHATNALLASAQDPLCDPGARFRLIGLLPIGQPLSARQQDWLVATYGIDELTIPAHGFGIIPPTLLWLKNFLNVAEPDNMLDIKRQLLWRQPLRNRRIASLAKQLSSGDVAGALGQLHGVPPGVEINIQPTRIVVLVEGVEHTITLAERLPGWPIISAPNAILDGLSDRECRLLSERRAIWPTGKGMIVTTTAAETLSPMSGGMTIILWAGGGAHRAPIPDNWLVCSADRMIRSASGPLPLVLIDIADRRPAALAKWARQRRNGYDDAGWFPPSSRPELPLIKRFLSRRPGGRG